LSSRSVHGPTLGGEERVPHSASATTRTSAAQRITNYIYSAPDGRLAQYLCSSLGMRIVHSSPVVDMSWSIWLNSLLRRYTVEALVNNKDNSVTIPHSSGFQ
jgi:hypothetical protein